MILTAAQLQILKADILADPILNAKPRTADGYVDIAAAYSVGATPDFFVYRTSIPVLEVYNAIIWANLTPNDAPVTTLNDAGEAWQNRALACQAKQFNLQILLQGLSSLDATKANIRAGLQDALTGVPSGSGGAAVSAGWVGVRDTVLARKALRGEKLFATVTVQQDGTTAAKAATMTQEGAVSAVNVEAALAA